MLKKILIFGNSGSGKSTLAKKISKDMSLPLIEIDALRWGDNWTRVDNIEFLNRLNKIKENKAWVVEDGSKITLENFKDCADIIIFLKTNVLICLYRLILRSFYRWLHLDNKKGEPVIMAIKHWRHCLRYKYLKKEDDFMKIIKDNKEKMIIINNNQNIDALITKIRSV